MRSRIYSEALRFRRQTMTQSTTAANTPAVTLTIVVGSMFNPPLLGRFYRRPERSRSTKLLW
jgi:hypothetical protein